VGRADSILLTDGGWRVFAAQVNFDPIALFRRGAAALPIKDPAEVDRLYKRLRLVVILSTTLGYAFFYTCRLGLSVVKKPLIDGDIYSPEQLGLIGAAFLWSYAIGKVGNGFVTDRVNVRYYMATGLALSAVMNLLMGSTTFLWMAAGIWAVNAWFQSTGAPASVVSVTQWYSAQERGTMYGIWSIAHSIGEGMTYLGTATLVAYTSWRFAFIGPGILDLGVAVVLALVLRDRPETVGLPPINLYKGVDREVSHPAAGSDAALTATEAQLILLRTPAVWVLGVSSALMYVTRYAVNNWGVLFLQEAHGLSLMEAGSLIGVNTIAGIAGSAAYGIISDRFFAARRPPVNLLFGLVEMVGLGMLYFAPRGSVWMLTIGLVIYGFTMSGLLAVLGGLFAVDIAPRKATGAAMGIIGVFSYLGAGIQEVVSGLLIGHGTTVVDGVKVYDFTVPILFWVGASVLSMLLAATLWKVNARE